MGASDSKPTGGAQLRSSATFKFKAIADKYTTLEQVQEALRRGGLESSQLIVAVDFTKSNEWTGRTSFNGQCLHATGMRLNPYEEAISIIGRTLRAFDDDGLIPAYGFGDVTTGDRAVFSFLPGDQPLQGLDAVLTRYRELVPHIKLAGPTSFAPAINQAMQIVARSGGQYHILLLIADGQVTRSEDLRRNQLSPQEEDTMRAIIAASNLPLSIIMIGVGDGPWEKMKEFDDALPQRAFDNFQFVQMADLGRGAGSEEQRSARFALRALMEIPEQYKAIQSMRLLGRPVPFQIPTYLQNPPGPAPAPSPAASGMMYPPPQAQAMGVPPAPAAAAAVAPAPYPPQALAAAAGQGASPDPMFICPITQDVMVDPVIAADGFTYERIAIEGWFATKSTSPMTNTPLSNRNLIPNHSVRSAIMEARQRGKIA